MLIVFLRILAGFFYLVVITMSKTTVQLFPLFIENFFIAGLTAVTKAFLKVKTVSSEMFIRSFRSKIVKDNTFTNSRLG